MKKLMLVLLLGGFLFTSCQKDDLSSQTELDAVEARGGSKNANKKEETSTTDFDFTDCAPVKTAELYAGQNTYVGTVTVESDGSIYTVTYQAIPGYCFSEIHFESTNMDDGFSLKGNGNPNPGGMDYKNDGLGCESSWTFTVPDQGPYLAAHAVMNCVETELPETTDFCTVAQGVDASSGSYFDITVDGIGVGAFGAWCVDVDLSLQKQECIEDALVYTSLDFDPSLFENPQNMFAVNWLLNNLDLIGTTSPDFGGTYNFGDFQNAIWLLIDDEGTRTGNNLGDYDATLTRAGELRDLALEEGVGFTPECGDFIGVILVPVDDQKIPNKQAVIFPFPYDCDDACGETAWARNSADSNDECGNLPGANWATYFVYDDSE